MSSSIHDKLFDGKYVADKIVCRAAGLFKNSALTPESQGAITFISSRSHLMKEPLDRVAEALFVRAQYDRELAEKLLSDAIVNMGNAVSLAVGVPALLNEVPGDAAKKEALVEELRCISEKYGSGTKEYFLMSNDPREVSPKITTRERELTAEEYPVLASVGVDFENIKAGHITAIAAISKHLAENKISPEKRMLPNASSLEELLRNVMDVGHLGFLSMFTEHCDGVVHLIKEDLEISRLQRAQELLNKGGWKVAGVTGSGGVKLEGKRGLCTEKNGGIKPPASMHGSLVNTFAANANKDNSKNKDNSNKYGYAFDTGHPSGGNSIEYTDTTTPASVHMH